MTDLSSLVNALRQCDPDFVEVQNRILVLADFIEEYHSGIVLDMVPLEVILRKLKPPTRPRKDSKVHDFLMRRLTRDAVIRDLKVKFIFVPFGLPYQDCDCGKSQVKMQPFVYSCWKDWSWSSGYVSLAAFGDVGNWPDGYQSFQVGRCQKCGVILWSWREWSKVQAQKMRDSALRKCFSVLPELDAVAMST